jgi:hypothetical protein
MVSSMGVSPVLALYRAVNQLYNPLLLRDSAWSARLDPKLQTLLSELETALGTTVRAGSGGAGGLALDSFNGILSPLDEVNMWDAVARNAVGAARVARSTPKFLNRSALASRRWRMAPPPWLAWQTPSTTSRQRPPVFWS